jgi:uncharacterized protein YjaG (DUF416 family)
MNQLSEVDQLSAGIRALDRAKALAFGVCLLERAMPAFFQFQSDTGWKGGGVMRAALAQCWSILEGSSPDTVNFVSVPQCERVTPDSEGPFESDYTSASIDAVDIACNLLLYIESGDIDLILNSVTAQFDTIELFVQNYESVNRLSGAAIDTRRAQRILEEEHDFMRADLEFLTKIDTGKDELFSAILRRVSTLEYRTLRLKLLHNPG